MRTVIAAITEPTGKPREGLSVHFAAPEGHDTVIALTDASGVFRAALVPDVTYRVSVENAVLVDGVAFPAGTVFVVRVPEGEEEIEAIDAVIATIDASRPVLLDTIAALTARIDRLESALTQAGHTAGTTLGALRGEAR